jgi:hypothetical protein
MKNSRFKSLWGAALGLALLAAAPFAASAQTAASAAQRPDDPAPDDPENAVVTIEARFNGRGRFIFEGDKIQYWHIDQKTPSGMTVNGKPWDDLRMPFELGFIPDFQTAELVEKSFSSMSDRTVDKIELTRDEKQIRLLVRHDDSSDVMARVKMKKQPRRTEPEKAAEQGDGNDLILTGTLHGSTTFLLRPDSIEFAPNKESSNGYRERDNKAAFPTDVTVNGKPWTDLNPDKPFDLDFVSDFSKAKIVETSANVRCNLRSDYQLANPALFDRPFDRTTELLISSFPSSDPVPFRIRIVAGKTPADYEARIIRRRDTQREKQRRSRLTQRYRSNRGNLSESEIAEVEQWNKETMADTWNRDPDDSTDGKEYPPLDGGGLAVGTQVERPENEVTITIEALVDFSAGFRFTGNRVNFDAWPNMGRYPSNVRINGKPWKNLRMAFPMDYAVDLDSVPETFLDSEYYQYDVSKDRSSFTVRVRNHGPREEQITIRLKARKSDKPLTNEQMYPGGIPLPPEAMSSPEAFENFWKNAMRPRTGNSSETQPESK